MDGMAAWQAGQRLSGSASAGAGPGGGRLAEGRGEGSGGRMPQERIAGAMLGPAAPTSSGATAGHQGQVVPRRAGELGERNSIRGI